MVMIHTDPDRNEVGFLNDFYIDMEIGGSEDFEITLDFIKGFEDGCIIGSYGFEYGGIVTKIMSETVEDKVTYYGQTFRGMLDKKRILPSTGMDYKIVSGNVATIINSLFTVCSVDNFFVCEPIALTVTNFQFERYCTLLDGLDKMLKSVGYRMSIKLELDMKAHVNIETIKNYSNEMEFSSDYDIDLSVSRDNARVNHLICLGKGELKDRTVLHLYLGADGNVSTTKYYVGLNEVVDVFDYTSAENIAALQEQGAKKILSYEYEKAEVDIDGIEISLYDIVSARDYRTGIKIVSEVTRKIIKIYDDSESIEYKVGE